MACFKIMGVKGGEGVESNVMACNLVEAMKKVMAAGIKPLFAKL